MKKVIVLFAAFVMIASFNASVVNAQSSKSLFADNEYVIRALDGKHVIESDGLVLVKDSKLNNRHIATAETKVTFEYASYKRRSVLNGYIKSLTATEIAKNNLSESQVWHLIINGKINQGVTACFVDSQLMIILNYDNYRKYVISVQDINKYPYTINTFISVK